MNTRVGLESGHTIEKVQLALIIRREIMAMNGVKIAHTRHFRDTFTRLWGGLRIKECICITSIWITRVSIQMIILKRIGDT